MLYQTFSSLEKTDFCQFSFFALDTLKDVSEKPSDFHEDHLRALSKGMAVFPHFRDFSFHFLLCPVPHMKQPSILRHKMFHSFHFLKSSMVLGIVNPFS